MQVIRDYMENWGLFIPEVASLQGPALQDFQLCGVGNRSCPTGAFFVRHKCLAKPSNGGMIPGILAKFSLLKSVLLTKTLPWDALWCEG